MTGHDPALQAKLRRMGRLDDEQDWMDDDK